MWCFDGAMLPDSEAFCQSHEVWPSAAGVCLSAAVEHKPRGVTFDTADAATYNLPWFQHAIAICAVRAGCSPAIHAVVWTAFLLLR